MSNALPEIITYDNNGNTQTMANASGTTTYSWDFENRLTSAALPGSGGTVTFKYDPFGRRIFKSSSTATSIYAYDGDNLIEETNAAGTAVARYSQGLNIDEPLAMLRSGTTSYYQADGLGSLTSLSNASGALANTYTYDSFGNIIASTGTLTNSFRYTGREFDTETSLYYYRARYYDASAGRFTSEDPLRFDAGINFYRYVKNNAANLTDPLGLYQLKGFTPGDAAEMTIAIEQLITKLNSMPCCVDPKLRDRLLNLLQPGNTGSGVTFVYQPSLPDENCAQVGVANGYPFGNFWRFLTNRIDISEAAFGNPRCGCLASTILHELNHLTWRNYTMAPSKREADSHDVEVKCFGQACAGN
jgi:RHS repeat-associated protein